MIHIIIPVFNRLNYTIRCIDSLEQQQNLKDKLNIIVVDSCSTDGTDEFIKKNYPYIKILKVSGSLFWGGAVNYGINYILQNFQTNDFILLLNNDVELSPSAIQELIKILTSNQRKAIAGALSIDLLDKKTIIKSGTIVKSWFFNWTKHIYKGVDVNKLNNRKPLQVDFLTGRCLLHPIEMFKITGNYDSKSFPHYGGDDEFSMRAKKFGYETLLCPTSIVYLNNEDKNTLKNFSFKNFLFLFFNIKSSSNIINKFKLSLKIAPLYAKLTFFIFGLLKSFYIFLKQPKK